MPTSQIPYSPQTSPYMEHCLICTASDTCDRCKMRFHYEGDLQAMLHYCSWMCALSSSVCGTDPTWEGNKCYECTGHLLLLSSNNICTLTGKRCCQLFDGCNICTYENYLKCLHVFYIKSSSTKGRNVAAFTPTVHSAQNQNARHAKRELTKTQGVLFVLGADARMSKIYIT